MCLYSMIYFYRFVFFSVEIRVPLPSTLLRTYLIILVLHVNATRVLWRSFVSGSTSLMKTTIQFFVKVWMLWINTSVYGSFLNLGDWLTAFWIFSFDALIELIIILYCRWFISYANQTFTLSSRGEIYW